MSSHQAMSPNQREVISAVSTITGKQEYLTSTSGALNINGSFTVTGGATSANQTNGQQLVQIVDAGGEAATVTGGKLDVNATASLAGSPIPISGASTAVGVAIVDGSGNQITSFGGGTQYTDGGTPPTHPIGPTLEFNNAGTWTTVGSATPLPVSATFSPSGTQDINLKQINGNTTSTGNGVAGTGVQRVTIASDNTAFPVNATLSAETTKVIGTVNQGTSPWITSNATTSVVGNGAAATAQRVTIANDSTGVLATVGAVTAITNALPAGTNVIGHVITDTGSTTAVTGTVTISGTVTANAGTNLNTSLLALESGGNLASIKANTDNLNLAIGSTTSGQKGNLVLTATTTAAPTYTTAQSNPLSTTTTGLLRVDGSGVTQPVSLTSTTITGTVAVTQSGTWTNTVTQATAANLNATVVGTGTFAVQATLSAETTKVIGTVNQGTSPWVTSLTSTTITSDIPGTGATNLGKAEDAGHTTGDTGVMALGVRNDTLLATTNATADYTQLSTDTAGIVMTAGAPRALKANQVTTITSSTAETTIVTAVASTFLDMYGLMITNTSATAVNVAIKDATAGTTRLNLAVPAGDTRGYMLPQESAIKQTAVNGNWTATSSASVASLIVTALTTARV